MAKNAQITLKPQDLLVMLKLASDPPEHFTYAALSEALGLASSQVHAAVSRCMQARLVSKDENGINLRRSVFLDFLIYGAAFCFPAVFGSMTRGVPTGYAAPPLSELINQPDDPPPVWPYPGGQTRGIALHPIYPSVPEIALQDTNLYQALALFDALRAGSARERELAQRLIREIL